MADDFYKAGRRAATEAAKPSDNGHRHGPIVLRDATDVTIQRVQWIEEGRIPLGEITVLAGIGGLGKSLWMCDRFARITRGDSDLGEPKSVVLLSAEDAWTYTLKPRLIAAGADLDRVKYLNADQFVIPDGIPRIEAAIREHPESIAALGLDPLIAFIGDDTDTHRDHDTRRALGPLAAMANRLNIGVLGIMHLNKKDGSDPYKRLSSSVAFWNAVRSVLIWGEDPDDSEHRVLASGKMNLAPKPDALRYRLDPVQVIEDGVRVEAVKLVPVGIINVEASQVISGAGDGTQAEKAENTIRSLWMQAGGAILAEEAYEAGKERGDISRATMRRARERLGGEARKTGFDNSVWEWVPPAGTFPRPEKDDVFETVTERNPLTSKASPEGITDDAFEETQQEYDFFSEETRRLRGSSSPTPSKASSRPAPQGGPRCATDCGCNIMANGLRQCQAPDPM